VRHLHDVVVVAVPQNADLAVNPLRVLHDLEDVGHLLDGHTLPRQVIHRLRNRAVGAFAQQTLELKPSVIDLPPCTAIQRTAAADEWFRKAAQQSGPTT